MNLGADQLWTRRSMLGLGVLAAGFGAAACGSGSTPSAPTSKAAAPDARDPIARDAYIFGYPLVLMDVTRAAGPPANRFAHAAALPGPADKQMVRVNLDTLYSQAWLDLSDEPMVLQIPAMSARRYWLMQLMDAWTNTVHNPSSVHPRTTAAPYTYLLTGPSWNGTVPHAMTRLAMPTPTSWLVGRIQVRGQDDLAEVRQLQQRIRLTPLSVWTGNPPEGAAAVGLPVVAEPPPKTVAGLDSRAFFDRMCALMADNPPAAADRPAVQRFADIGIEPGGRGGRLLPLDVLDAAVAQGKQTVADYIDPATQRRNGWMFATNIGTYGTDYLLRANVALRGLGANLPQDAIYPTTVSMADARGVAQRFRLHFPPGLLPPVDAFWSITAYDADSYLVDNPAGIYTVGQTGSPVTNRDGSVDIVAQFDQPASALASRNWLPIPKSGPFSLTMRLYAPKPAALDGRWRPPPLSPV